MNAARGDVSGQTDRGASCLALLIVCSLWSGYSFAQALPHHVVTLADAAEEDYFEGDYESADRRIVEASEWIKKPVNKTEIAKTGGDHSWLEAQLDAFRAEILYALGKDTMAIGKVKHATKTIKNRRKTLEKRVGWQPGLLQFDAFLALVKGDILKPVPDFGLADDPSLPEDVRKFFKARSESWPSIRAYQQAEAFMSQPQARNGGSPEQNVRINRLDGRVLSSLAWVRILKSGPPKKSDVDDAQDFLKRAEESFERSEIWRKVIGEEHVDGKMPKTFKQIEDAKLKPEERRRQKRMFSQTIQDWLGMQMLTVEVTAFQEQATPEDLDALQLNAEQIYDQIIGFLKAQYREGHPRLQSVHLSRARWLLALIRSMKDDNPKKRMSLLKDALLDVQRVTNLSASEMLQKRVLEIAVRTTMLGIDEAAGGLQGDERKSCADRLAELRKELEDQVGKSAQGAADSPTASDDEADDNGEEVGDDSEEK